MRSFIQIPALIESVPMPGRRRWSKEAIAEAIVQRRKAGKSLEHNAVRKEDLALLGAAYNYYGSWGVAVRAAGLPYKSRQGGSTR